MGAHIDRHFNYVLRLFGRWDCSDCLKFKLHYIYTKEVEKNAVYEWLTYKKATSRCSLSKKGMFLPSINVWRPTWKLANWRLFSAWLRHVKFGGNLKIPNAVQHNSSHPFRIGHQQMQRLQYIGVCVCVCVCVVIYLAHICVSVCL